MKRYKTRRDACEAWVHEFNAIPRGVIVKLMEHHMDDVREITPFTVGDDVEVLFGDDCGDTGTVHEIDGDDVTVLLCDSAEKKFKKTDLEVRRDDVLPMWGTMWSFGDSIDEYWLESMGGLQIIAELGFRIYEQEDYGYIFGIDGAGFSFYDRFWIPLYSARGLRWSEEDNAAEENENEYASWVNAQEPLPESNERTGGK